MIINELMLSRDLKILFRRQFNMKESQLHYQDCGSVEVCINSQCPEKHKCRPKRRTCLDLRYFYIGLGGLYIDILLLK